MDKDNAVWGTVTLAMPALVQWQIEGGEFSEQGDRLQSFFKAMARVDEKAETTLRITCCSRSKPKFELRFINNRQDDVRFGDPMVIEDCIPPLSMPSPMSRETR